MKSLTILRRLHLFLLQFVINLVTISTADTISTSDFIQLQNKTYFIDKTDFIEEFFEDDWRSYTFITCPRGFGKTINLQMIELFAGIELDENHKVKDPTNTTAYEIFKDLIVFENDQVVADHLGQYVTIHLDLKSDRLFPGYTNETAVQFLSHKLFKAFEPYKWLLDLPKEDLLGREQYKGFVIVEEDIAFLANLTTYAPLNELETTLGLHRIAYILMVYFQTDVIILVDNYDSVLSHAIKMTKQNVLIFYGIVGEMIRKALTQPVATYGLVTAVSGLILPKVRKTMNRATHYRFLGEHRFYEYFAFTEDDMNDLMDRYDLPLTRVSDLNYVYGGYKSIDDQAIFHPESVIKYIENFEQDQNFRTYWRHSDEDNFIKDILRDKLLRHILDNVVNKFACRFTYVECYEDYEDLEKFYDIRLPLYYDKMYQDISLSYIFDHGYLSWTNVEDEFFAPNSQARHALKKILASFTWGSVD